jgi:ADP-ribose pyrophosphatase YjhB (NUDIX family)
MWPKGSALQDEAMSTPAHAAEEVIRRRAIELLAVAQSGLTYVRDPFDKERYQQVREAAVSLLELVANGGPGVLRRMVEADAGHATPKVDVRGAVFRHGNEILLMRERSDGCWTLPGGWCDVLESPAEAVCREVREETGYTVEVFKLAAVLDREKHGHQPPFPFHVYKMFFLCRATDVGVPDPTETIDIGWFPVKRLPPLSISRVTDSQLRMLQDHYDNSGLPTIFD